MRRISLYVLLPLLLASTCKRDKRERLFEIFIPNITFDIPAGLTGGLPRVFELDNLTSGVLALAKNAGVDTALIVEIRPRAATLSSIQGNGDYSFLREVVIRVCRSGSAECRATDEAFNMVYYDDRRIGSRINMNPSLPNLRRTLIRDRFKLEILFYLKPGAVSPTAISTRLDMIFEAVK
ncbi:MAG: hypothetical protein IPO07_05705 [Haliscomenobacter sp.]|nr:hypothetical protein [Haliscomenobacter sp.]MBK9488332.1 hypothetical protein [Haliscomenobacter sp.]